MKAGNSEVAKFVFSTAPRPLITPRRFCRDFAVGQRDQFVGAGAVAAYRN